MTRRKPVDPSDISIQRDSQRRALADLIEDMDTANHGSSREWSSQLRYLLTGQDAEDAEGE